MSQAFRESVAYWHAATLAGAKANAEEFTPDEWTIFASVEPPTYDVDDVEDGRLMPEATARQWGPLLRQELLDRWAERTVLPLHRDEIEATRKLARRVAKLDLARGYAMYAALRWFWGRQETPPDWWRPEVWMGVSDD